MKFASRILAVLGLLAFSATAVPAAAALLNVNGPFGPNTLTDDTSTGLEWLNVSFAVGQSYNHVSGQMGPHGEYAGFRYATIAEITKLFTDAGLHPISSGPPTAGDYTPGC